MPYLVTPDGVPLYYEDEGPRDNSAIFLIHAEPFNTKFWQRNIGLMAEEIRVVSMDVRGRGESGKTDQGHSLAQYARDFRFMLESLGLERVVAAGWSMGSAILWRYVELFGEDRMAGFADVDQRPYRFRSFDDLLEKLEAIRNCRLEDHRKAVVDYFGPEAKVPDGLIDWMSYECMKTPTSTHRAAAWESYFADFRPVLTRMDVPSRVFWARYGVIDEPTARLLLTSLKNSKEVFFEHSGHLLPWTESEKFNAAMLAFAREVL
jgi:pimeloyl-ACP methyl ester carboxylesterase